MKGLTALINPRVLPLMLTENEDDDQRRVDNAVRKCKRLTLEKSLRDLLRYLSREMEASVPPKADQGVGEYAFQ